MEQKQKLMDEQRSQNATEQFLKAVGTGMDPEVAAHNIPGLGVAGYNLGLETAKQVKKKAADEEALKQLPNFQAAAGQTLGPKGEVLAAPNVGAAQALYGGVSDELKPIFNLGVDARNAAVNAQAAEIKRTADEAALASRRSLSNTLTSQTHAANEDIRRSATVQKNSALFEDLSRSYALATQDQQDQTFAQRSAIIGPAAASKERSELKQLQVGLQIKAARELKAAAGESGAKIDATKAYLDAVRSGDVSSPASQDAQSAVYALGLGVINSDPPPGMPSVILTRDSQSLKLQQQMTNLRTYVDLLQDNIVAVSKDPESMAKISGLKGLDQVQQAFRVFGSQPGPIADLSQTLTVLMKAGARLNDSGNVAAWEQKVAAQMFPLLTEIIKDGKINASALHRISNMRKLETLSKYSVYLNLPGAGEQAKSAVDRIDRELEADLLKYSPKQRQYLQKFGEAARAGDTQGMFNAAKGIQGNVVRTRVDNELDSIVAPGVQ